LATRLHAARDASAKIGGSRSRSRNSAMTKAASPGGAVGSRGPGRGRGRRTRSPRWCGRTCLTRLRTGRGRKLTRKFASVAPFLRDMSQVTRACAARAYWCQEILGTGKKIWAPGRANTLGTKPISRNSAAILKQTERQPRGSQSSHEAQPEIRRTSPMPPSFLGVAPGTDELLRFATRSGLGKYRSRGPCREVAAAQ
jgi:hypothetical protein